MLGEMTLGEGVAVGSALLTLICVVASAVWIVGRVKANSEINAEANKRLSETLDRVSLRLDHIDERTEDHEGRLIRLETIQGGSSGPGNRAS